MEITQERINESLDNATINGYPLKQWTPETIAQDLIEYDVDFEEVDPVLLVPFIKNWLGKLK